MNAPSSVACRAVLAVFATACGAKEKADPPPAATPIVSAAGVRASTDSIGKPDIAVDPELPADTVIRTDTTGHIVTPVVFRNICEGEDCRTSFLALACFPATLQRAAVDTATATGHVATGDTVSVSRRDLHLLRPGSVIFRRKFTLASYGDNRHPRSDTLRFAVGDTLYLLHYDALGDWSWWYQGKVDSGSEFWASDDDKAFGDAPRITDTSTAIRTTHPVTDDWWLVRAPHGGYGWWRADSLGSLRSIDMMAYWGEHCPSPAPTTGVTR